MTIVIGDELSDEDRIFQRPGPEIFPAVGICLDIRELQLQRKMFMHFIEKVKGSQFTYGPCVTFCHSWVALTSAFPWHWCCLTWHQPLTLVCAPSAPVQAQVPTPSPLSVFPRSQKKTSLNKIKWFRNAKLRMKWVLRIWKLQFINYPH